MKHIASTLLLLLVTLLGSCAGNGKGLKSATDAENMDSLWYPMDSISVDSSEVHTCLSEDGKMKFYSWNTGMGGTCPDFAVLCQFRTTDGKTAIVDFCAREGEPAWVDNVHSIQKEDGTTYYITVRSHRASSNDGYMWMDGFAIDSDTLKNVSVFDGGDDLDECGLSINYVIADWYYTTNGEGWDWLFDYDTKTRKLYVPQVALIDEVVPVINDRYRVYQFNGLEFVDLGVQPHKGLHASLSDYKRLASYYRTKGYIVRVDELKDRKYRYVSWKSSATTAQKPELVIVGGRYDEDSNSYRFENEGVEYIVGYSEDKPLDGGGYEHHEFLLVKKDGKVLLKEERISPYNE